MLPAFFSNLKSIPRRSMGSRLGAKSRTPMLESMESRCLLTSYISIDTPTVSEGTGGLTPITFTVKLFSPATNPVTVDYQTADVGSATGGSEAQALHRLNNAPSQPGVDFIHTSGTLSFGVGDVTKTITVQVVGDSEVELTELFYVNLSNPTNAVLIKSTGVGTIMDDDAVVTPELSINNVSMRRGLSGIRYMTFTVSLNTAVNTEVSVRATTRNATAMAGVDYDAKQQNLVFAPGETTKSFVVKVYGTPTLTSSKVFAVNLTHASVALKIGTGIGTLSYGN